LKQRSVLVPIVTALVVASGLMAAPAPSPTPDMAREAVVAALAAGGDIPGQARNLAKLAWPAGKRDELVSARARVELENFGDHAMLALRDALNSVKTEYTEEVVVTTIGAQRQSRIEMSSTHLPILLDTLWVGSHAAKVRAIVALAETHSPVAVQPLIDSAIADPSLAQSVIELLGAMRYQPARFYLEKVMMEGSPALRPVAASSLAQIGGAAIVPLRNALKTDSRDARLLAARAILPAANEYDIGAIYEYIEKHGDDDPGVTQALKSLAAKIEAAIAARDASAAAGSLKNF
jgi:HEAT repeat protein